MVKGVYRNFARKLAPSVTLTLCNHITGLQQTEQHLRAKNIPFYLLFGDPQQNVPSFCQENRAYCLVVDFSPVRIQLGWVQGVRAELATMGRVPFVQVDAHNVVPCWHASDKLEYGARTIRPKIVSKVGCRSKIQGRIGSNICSLVGWLVGRCCRCRSSLWTFQFCKRWPLAPTYCAARQLTGKGC